MAQPQPRVLVVTTVHSIYTLIQRTLKAQGFHTTHTISYDEAQTYLEDETHHLIILDLTHTRQQQIDDYHRLRQRTTIPLIVLIDDESEQNNGTIADIVTDDYLYYPFDPENLLSHVRNALRPRQTQATEQPYLHLGTTTIHFDERQAMCNGQKIYLTRTEWKLLEILALHHGKTLTYRTLLQHVWGDAYHDEHSYVHTYISQLRRKLELDPTKPRYLLTEVGVGYRLEASTNSVQSTEEPITTDSTSEKITETPWELTTPHTKLFGRETDIKAIQYLLGQTDVRLLTLTGPPGVGKTRLAQHIAETIKHQFSDGLYTVSLAPLRDHSLVASAITQAIGAKESAHQTLHEALMQTLKGQQALLFLDNFEHVLEAASLITKLIAIAPDLTILITSRTPLRISGEQEYPVPSLTTPDSTIPASLETLAHNPTVALFVRRSQAVKPDFVLTDENAPAVAAICTRLDGLPLAIELAAARSKLFSPQAMLARLDQRLTLLSHNTTDAPARHQTLRAAIDWSYQLLQPEEQRILAGLSVFAGGCTLEAATSVLNNDQQLLPEPPLSTTSLGPDPQTLTMVNHLTTLVDHSLVQVKEDINNESRFTLLETIREYAWEKLGESSKMEQVQQRFADYYLELVEKAAPEFKGSQQVWWLNYLNQEYENICIIIQWMLTEKWILQVLRMGSALWQFWWISGKLSDGNRYLTAMLSHETLSEAHNDKQTRVEWARVLNGAGSISLIQGYYQLATKHFTNALNFWEKLNDEENTAHALNNLGNLSHQQNDYALATKYHMQSLGIRRKLDKVWDIAVSLTNLSFVELDRGNYTQSMTFGEESYTLFQKTDDKWGMGASLNNVGRAALLSRNYDTAITACNKSLKLFQELKSKFGIAHALVNLLRVHLDQQDREQVTIYGQESLLLFKELNDVSGSADCLEAIAEVAISHTRWSQAIHLCSVATKLRNSVNTPRSPSDNIRYEQTLTFTREQLNEDTWQQTWNEGQKMSLEEAIDYALEHVTVNEREVAS
ncbi:MAG: hypothetical protein GFH27_549305n116 [Chloroflexi bacterium AL-W]|nr:hypothetical protein [Chloroflexi bacterium AL-N1]NOK69362.1 hypothetical protein [Chloroflexi bacterium AL-N10]NOK76423.1 hypothetical protein [Chloroflexi bacterium AL-N5]NOK83540.1 hypothetical protein [Chloroflexi bacterium AL-W]NOK91200.1 hypothetical protein [Chloroflexi bacterium AL-N15]